MEKDFIDLFEFQSKLKEGVECLFPKKIWLRAEVSAIKVRSGGHCYMELSQSGENGLVAKAGAVIWSSKYRFLAPYFESVTGTPIAEGMSVLVQVQPSYSHLYGLSLIINDIDPDYSIGLKEQERLRTIERLEREGLAGLQKKLALPLLPGRLAVISASDAAGYRDFMRHLHENEYGFAFVTDLYPAQMQGVSCPESVVAALDAVLGSGKEYDAVLILRGGGAKLDLACYDDYLMASVIAQYPLPVLTAVGHDQDYHVCDMVAHEYLKTPTALADFFIGIYEAEDERLSYYRTRMQLAFSGRLSVMEGMLGLLRSRIRGGAALRIGAMEAAVDLLAARIAAADPRAIVERGYVLVTDSGGVVVKTAHGRGIGERMSLVFKDGTVDCVVSGVRDLK
ncbi:MAG: exodeoxyribonuclease VII large subunit [Bacteroidales bacterium]|nr:exodeoxyribonuclease VII large subunit [Bacteroidales bacterium]